MWKLGNKLFGTNDKTLVGRDKSGNKYFLHRQDNEVKREVEFANNDLKSVSTLPPLWRLWLYKRRDDPPSDEEISKFNQQQEIRSFKAKEWQEQDAKAREQELLDPSFDRKSTSGAFEAFIKGVSGKDPKSLGITQTPAMMIGGLSLDPNKSKLSKPEAKPAAQEKVDFRSERLTVEQQSELNQPLSREEGERLIAEVEEWEKSTSL